VVEQGGVRGTQGKRQKQLARGKKGPVEPTSFSVKKQGGKRKKKERGPASFEELQKRQKGYRKAGLKDSPGVVTTLTLFSKN